MRNSQYHVRRVRPLRGQRSTFLYDLTVLLDEFDDGEHEDRVYVREFAGKFKEYDDRD
jgi:hypothetical protein